MVTATSVRPTPEFVTVPPSKSVRKPPRGTSTTTHLVPADAKTDTATNALLEPTAALEMTRNTVTLSVATTSGFRSQHVTMDVRVLDTVTVVSVASDALQAAVSVTSTPTRHVKQAASL